MMRTKSCVSSNCITDVPGHCVTARAADDDECGMGDDASADRTT
jgi:hypothetical protein